MSVINSTTDIAAANRYLNLITRNRQKTDIPAENNSKHFVDYFERSSVQPTTYKQVTKTPTETEAIQKPEMDYSTQEGKDEIGEYYNSVLEGLRSKYEEPEAMRRFDDFMRSEGYISIHSEEYKSEYENNSPFTLNAPFLTGTKGAATPSLSWGNAPEGLQGQKNISDATYQVRSEFKALYKDGKTEYLAESYGIMHSDRSWTEEAKEIWQSKSAQIDGFDAKSYLDGVPDGERRAVVGASNSLGESLAAALGAAGITLNEGESLVLSFPTDFKTGAYIGKVSTGRSDIDHVINTNPELLNSIIALRDSAGASSLKDVPGQYQDGTRNVSYSQERQLVYSPSNSDAVVATDIVNVKASGYTYIKKVSDEFYPSCDSHKVIISDDSYNIMANNGKSKTKEMYDSFADDLNRAMTDGTTVKSTITADEYNAIKAERTAKVDEFWHDFDQNSYLITKEGAIPLFGKTQDKSAAFSEPVSDTVEEPVSTAMSESVSKLSPAVQSLLKKYKELAKYIKF